MNAFVSLRTQASILFLRPGTVIPPEQDELNGGCLNPHARLHKRMRFAFKFDANACIEIS